MTLMSGLVEVTKDRIDGSLKSTIGYIVGEWMIRNAVAVVLGACILFWAVVGALFLLG